MAWLSHSYDFSLGIIRHIFRHFVKITTVASSPSKAIKAGLLNRVLSHYIRTF
nr:MAG TPA: hypothetical protein [Caudoviricetes sp.]